ESVTDIITTVDENGSYNYYNKAVESLLGYSSEETLHWQVGDAAIPEDRELIREAHRQAMNNPGTVVRITYRCRHKNGSLRVFQTTRQLVNKADGQGKEMVIHARDITDQYLAEEALRKSEERLRDFAETGADWFWEQDADLRYTYLSGHFPDHNDRSADDVIGKTREEIAADTDFDSEEWQMLSAKLAARKPFQNFEYAFPRLDGSNAVIRISGIPIFDGKGEFTGYRGTGVDITESFRLSEQLNYQATHDPLTGLVNRREFEQRLNRVVRGCQEDDSEHALCYIDLDQFKVVNDTCGHDAGDELLRQIAALLNDKVRKRDTIARLGGDEFGLLLERCTLPQANRVAETVREAIDNFRFMWSGRHFRLGASIGVIQINFSSGNISNVMRSADAACYAAKDAGRNRIHVYNEDNVEVAKRRQEMMRIFDINQAFDEGRFILYQQPIATLNPNLSQDGHFCEMLVRMLDEDGFPVQPGVFLSTAERYNLITQLDTWVVNKSIQWLAQNPSVRCNINLSAMSIVDESFLQFVLELLDESHVHANRVCFEITETAAIANLSKATYFINQLRDRGCFFALDDFGSGLSSFAYLKTLPVNFLKIDGFFVRDMIEDRIDYELVKSINDVGHVMGKMTIAEFVESEEVLQALKEIGIDYAQGYSIAKPEPIRTFREKRDLY
ncbi:MAG: EAL domain-containing protein, partial [Pseudomonadota bacterium]